MRRGSPPPLAEARARSYGRTLSELEAILLDDAGGGASGGGAAWLRRRDAIDMLRSRAPRNDARVGAPPPGHGTYMDPTRGGHLR